MFSNLKNQPVDKIMQVMAKFRADPATQQD